MINVTNWLSNNYIEVFGAVAGIVYVFLEIRQNIWLWPVGIITSAVYIWVFFTSKFYADMSLQVYYLVISLLGWYWWTRGTRVRRSLSEGGGHGAPTYAKASVGNAGHTASSEALAKEEGEGLKQEWEIEAQRRFRNSGKGREGDEVTQRLRDLEPEGLRDKETEGQRDEETEGLAVTRLKLKTGIFLAIVFVILYGLMWVVLSNFTDSPVPAWDTFITSLSIVATWMLARKIYEHWFLWIVVNFVSAAIFMIKGLYPTVILYIVYGVMSFAGLVAWKSTISNNLRSIKE